MSDGVRIDGMCISILRDKDTDAYADYFYVASLWAPDPRYKSRHMEVGESRGLFRIEKQSLNVTLLYGAKEDVGEKCFNKAANKVLREYQSTGAWVDKTMYAAG